MRYLLFLLLFGSCSFIEKKPHLSDSSREVPTWIFAPYEGCQEELELCASGEAKTYAEADLAAKANLASIFEVNVKSELNMATTSTQSFPWQGRVKEEVRKSLQESVEQVLETVQIKKRFKKEGLIYALASLDRAKAGELLGSRLQKLDDKLNTLWTRKSRTNLRKIVRLYLEREKLNERYSIVTGQGVPARMTYEEIIRWRESRPKVEDLTLRIGQAPEWMIDKLKELLTEAGFKIVRGDSSKMLSLNVESIKEFLNVEGFEKYTFTMNLTSFEKGEKKKVVSTSETVTGRTQADALLKIRTYFIDYIEQHLSDLHLD